MPYRIHLLEEGRDAKDSRPSHCNQLSAINQTLSEIRKNFPKVAVRRSIYSKQTSPRWRTAQVSGRCLYVISDNVYRKGKLYLTSETVTFRPVVDEIIAASKTCMSFIPSYRLGVIFVPFSIAVRKSTTACVNSCS
jgi:hypothetical protein